MSPDRGSGTAPRLNVLHERQIGLLHAGAMRVLESTGVEVRHEVALDLLKKAGGRADGSRAFIPARLVDRALETAPSRITLWDREGNPVMPLDEGRTYFGGSSDNPEILDPYLRQRRPLNRADVVLATRLCDALPNVDFIMSGGLVSDVDPQVADRVAFKEMALNTTQPLMFCGAGRRSLDDIVETAAAVAGGLDGLTARPFICHYSEPVSPLTHSTDAVDKLLRCSELGLPCVYIPMPMAGAT
ncbi:MAG: trimethylamine methyltransferase family protein, partial [Bacillota bacterium]